jgi:hypothetical protein
MNTRQESTKLAELRSKTDRQLVALISSRLDAGLNSAPVAVDAQNVYDEVSALMPCVNGLTRVERRRLESKFEQLRDLLHESNPHAGMRVQAACS